MMKYLILIVSVFVSGLVCADESPGVGVDKELINHLAKIEFLVETRKFPLTVRVFRESDFGECDNGKNCPKSRLYVITMSHDEYPEIKSFITQNADKWEFVRWIKYAKEETGFTELELKMSDKERKQKSDCILSINIFDSKFTCSASK